ncbi:hypothetical protein [Anaerosporobacter sp.]
MSFVLIVILFILSSYLCS